MAQGEHVVRRQCKYLKLKDFDLQSGSKLSIARCVRIKSFARAQYSHQNRTEGNALMNSTTEIFKPESRTILQIFSDTNAYYQMPNYQRPYSWEDEQVEQLWDDLITAFENHQDDPSSNPNYFLGSIILVPNGDRFDVVDGQQRLTTLTILFCTIRDCFAEFANKRKVEHCIVDRINDIGRLKLTTHAGTQNEFEQTIVKKIQWPTKFSKKEKIANKYMNSALIFRSKLESLSNSDLDQFLEYIFNKVRMITIECTTQSFAIRLFQVLNARGLDLTPADLIKSYLLQKLPADQHTQFMANWQYIENVAKQCNEDLTKLFNYYLYFLLGDNPKKGLYEEFEAQIRHRNSNEVIFEVKHFVDSYRSVLDSKYKSVLSLQYLKHELYWKSILTTAKHLGFEDFDDLALVLERYFYSYWIAGFTSAKIKQTSFNVLKALKNKKSMRDILIEIEAKLAEDKVADRLRTSLTEDAFGESWVKPVLIRIEYNQVDDSNALNFIEIDRNIHVEHILPQGNRNIDYWRSLYTDLEAKELVHKLANLTLLSGKKNLDASNRSFPDKLAVYAGKGIDGITGFRMTQHVHDKYKRWDRSELDSRSRWLFAELEKWLGFKLSDSGQLLSP